MSSKRLALYPSAPNTARGQATKISSHGSKVVYANARSIIIRDLENDSAVTAYAGHIQPTTVARISPSGYYCASADTSGLVRIWDTVGEENILKGEYRVLGGRINDLAWDGESKRIIAVGDGREKFGHAFMMETGSSTGDIIGHSKPINAVAIRHQRPFRAATAADDGIIAFHNGVPFKYDKTIKTHSKFVQSLSYSSSGDHFASAGSDFKVFVYDGKTGENAIEIPNAHTGTVYAVSWSPDNRTLLTSAADRTVKLWDVETQKSIISWTVGDAIQSQQVGNTWAGKSSDTGIVSVSLSGDLNIFDKRSSSGPVKILQGVQKAVTSATVTSDGTYVAGSADGRVVAFSDNGVASVVKGEGHSNFVSGLSSTANSVWSAGYDDHVRAIFDGAFQQPGTSTASQPKGIAAFGDLAFVIESDSIEIVKPGSKTIKKALSYDPSAIGVSSSGVVAVGGNDHQVHILDQDLTEKGKMEGNKGPITAISFSPDSKLVAVGDSAGKIVVYDVAERKATITRWTYHSAKITSLSWASDSKHLVSGSLDTHVYVWDVARPAKNIAIKNAVPGGVNAVNWIEADGLKGKIGASGADPCIRFWEVIFHA
ncbi:WD40 repeat-like protein [Sistotremastrum suecicum HHB10207 ss-3]|uniref:WD40 repeat-like protein n=1 Tax=Sistotremastrum suecicum HHB10207 ss-3 TaxID=1314776 RepID=A0A166FEX5_9AGAM|nr:WD40 repeat-like protein [Sistotremastrum suecicum HHB10207 ss-3]